MKKFDNILSQIAETEGVQPDEVLKEMQRAIQEAYAHRDESNQVMWDALSVNGECPNPEDFIERMAMMIQSENTLLQ